MDLKGSKGVIWEGLEGGKGRRNDVIIISRNKNNKIKPTRWKESNGPILKKKKRSGSG